jgi:hypothetical protein
MPTANQDNAAILALHEAGKSTRQIEAILGNIDHATVAKRLKHLTPRKTTEIFKTLRGDILAEKQRQILSAVDAKAIKQMAPRDRVTAMAILYDKERIERGLSDGASKPMIMVQINTPGGAEAKAKQVDNAQFGGTFGGIKDEGKT